MDLPLTRGPTNQPKNLVFPLAKDTVLVGDLGFSWFGSGLDMKRHEGISEKDRNPKDSDSEWG